MKKSGSFPWFLILGLLLLLSNCSKPTTTHINKEESFLKMFIGECSINSEIQFLPVQEVFSLRDNIWLHTKNVSQDTIFFPPDSYIR